MRRGLEAAYGIQEVLHVLRTLKADRKGWPTKASGRSVTDPEKEWRIMFEETARLDECEIFEFLKVAKDFPEYFPAAES